MTPGPGADALFDETFSPRLRAYVAQLRRDPARTAGAGALAGLLARRGIPAWPCLFDIETRLGGVVLPGGGVIGVWESAREGGWSADPPLLRVDRDFRSDDDAGAPIAPEVDGTWLVRVGVFDRDDGLYADEAGALYAHYGLSMRAYPAAAGIRPWFERLAVSEGFLAARRAVSLDDHFVEAPRVVGAALAAALGLPLVAEASCAVCSLWSDGALQVSDGVTFGDPTGRSTRVVAVHDERALDAAVAAYAAAREGLRVVGWPNAATYGFAKALSARGVPCEVVTTYP